jgi:cytochrome c
MKTGMAAALIGGLFVSGFIVAQEPVPEDSARIGKQLFTTCRACHSLEKEGPQNNGPALYGVFGRRAGSSEGFDYSAAMKQSSLVWSERTLDLFLKNPQAAIPGTKMGYSGMPDEAQRKILIDYLKQRTR